ncbi:tRNA synthetases class I-domain-containing protein [Lentinula edodes]|nr:tRNA synthetases class I-domain-containing protein [Lentinula edodes]
MYRTLDHSYEMRQLRIFEQIVNNGLIHRRYRPVHYSPSSRSALAEAELVYKENHVSHSVYVTFALDHPSAELVLKTTNIASFDPIQLLVWTTTPWTLAANMGIAVHSDMVYTLLRRMTDSSLTLIAQSRLKALLDILGSIEILVALKGVDLVGLQYSPIFSSLCDTERPAMQTLRASHVTPESGIGPVHCAPAHVEEDYKLFRSYDLISSGTQSPSTAMSNTLICHIHNGLFFEKVANVVGPSAHMLIGQPVVEELRGVVRLFETSRKTTGCEEIYAQVSLRLANGEAYHRYWFANLDRIRDDALKALNDVTVLNPSSNIALNGVSPDNVYGVYLFPHYSAPKPGTPCPIGPVEEFLPPKMKTTDVGEWQKSTDTMDVWFDSGTSWSMLDPPAPSGGRSCRADICLEGSDQHRGWFQSQLLTAVGSASETTTEYPSGDATPNAKLRSPCSTLITHRTVLVGKGKKMSKSPGNIVSPLTIVLGGTDKKTDPAHGADILRLWAASVEFKTDISIGHTSLMRKDLGLVERFVMHELYVLEKIALRGYKEFDFAKVTAALVNFANSTLSSLYFDITKDCLYANSFRSIERKAAVTVLEKILDTMTSILAPILPHLAEEIRQHPKSKTFFEKGWKPLDLEWEDYAAAKI